MAESEVRARTRASSTRVVILVLGLAYLVLAVAGTAKVGWHEFGWSEPDRVFGVFGVSTLANILHGVLGLIATLSALGGAASAFAFEPVLGVVFTAMTAFGVVAMVADDGGDPLNLTWWNVVLYLVSAVACGYAYAGRVHELRARRSAADPAELAGSTADSPGPALEPGVPAPRRRRSVRRGEKR